MIAFAYDTLNRVCTKAYAATAIACGGTSGGYLVSYAYDLDGRLIAANDNSAGVTTPSASASFSQTASYDALNRPVALSWSPAAAQTPPASSSSVTFNHGYDADNRRISQAVNDNSWLQYPGPSSSSTAYTANALNQYTAVGAASPTYDANGALTYDGQFTYCYDVESRLTAIVTGSCATPTTMVTTYAYDAQGRRKSKTVGSAVTAYVTDADNREILEVNGTSGALQTWYAYGAGPNDVLNQVNIAAGTRSTLIPDLQGSVIGQLASSGTLTKVGYLPFGESTGTSTASNGFFYTGGRLDPETAGSTSQPSGIYYLRNRAYLPGWGKFPQVDPTGYGAGPNLYTYALNNPLSFTDPFGLTADVPPEAVAQSSPESTTVSELDIVANRLPPADAQNTVSAPSDLTLVSAQLPPNFKPPTNPAALPPKPQNIPPGWRVRLMPPKPGYPNGYWRLEKPMGNGGWQGIDPSTMKPGSQPDTHVPLPPEAPPPVEPEIITRPILPEIFIE